MKRLLIHFILFISVFHSVVASPQQLLQEANEAYKRSEFNYAVELYEQILQHDLESWELHYNLGNAYYKINRIGPAILHYERALRLKPLEDDIRYNLDIARSRTVDRMEQRPMLFYERWFLAAWTMQSLDGWAITIIILLVLLLTAISVYLFSKRVAIKKFSFYTMLFLFMMVIASAVFATKQYHKLNTEREAVVMQTRVTAKSSPSPQSPDLFLLHEGTKVFIRNTLGQWLEVVLANGNVGWIREEAVEII
jgi:tetratricopeptide (TPR) repeat protein